MTDPHPSVETERLRRLDARWAIYGKWLSRVFWAIVGLAITAYFARHLIREIDKENPPGIWHLAMIAFFALMGLVISAGKRSLDGIKAIGEAIREARGKGEAG